MFNFNLDLLLNQCWTSVC